MTAIDLNDPTATCLLAVEALGGAGIAHAVYGGLALAAYGEPRETKDADLAVADADVAVAVQALARTGVTVSVAFADLVIRQVIVLGFPAALGAAAARLIL